MATETTEFEQNKLYFTQKDMGQVHNKALFVSGVYSL